MAQGKRTTASFAWVNDYWYQLSNEMEEEFLLDSMKKPLQKDGKEYQVYKNSIGMYALFIPYNVHLRNKYSCEGGDLCLK